MTRISAEDLNRLEALHRQVDRLTAEQEKALEGRLVCRRGCSDCCQDDLTVFEIEAELIRARCGDLLDSAVPAEVGRCAFLDEEGACRIYRWRPYVCRTQGLPLRWFQEDEDVTIERRDICPLNLDTITSLGESLAEVPEKDCWTIGPWEGRLASLQAESSGRFESTRIPLRLLFGKS